MIFSQHDHITDAGLLENFYADGNNEWLGELMQRYTLLLYGVCMKYLKNEEEAKDAVQQIFLKAISELQKYPVTHFKSWLYTVSRNYCFMQLRGRGKAPLPVTERMINSDPDEENNIHFHQQNETTLSMLNEALEELNNDQKQCITLFYLRKKSYHEIAELTGYSMTKIKSYIQNGKRNLKIIMERKVKENKV
ncbi:MAG TPA: sigma-70 family RNA polymerase sigma factor [Agriterribacter sp.]|nr:sigma-70 family RNA polymerase sigma factor [Agriterribacter sp.]